MKHTERKGRILKITNLTKHYAGSEKGESISVCTLKSVIPLLVSGVFCMMMATSVSVSMEGRQFNIIKTLPIPAKAFYDAKLLFNLLLMLPFLPCPRFV